MITICFSIIYMLEACILWQYCESLFSSRHSGPVKALALFFSYLLLFILSLSENFWINFFMFLIINFCYILSIYKVRPLTAFFHSFLITIIMVLSELVIFSILSYFVPNYYDEENHFWNMVILTIPSKLLYFLILQHIALFVKKRKTRELSSDKSTLYLSVIPLISSFISLVFTTVCMNVHLSLFMNVMIAISAFLLLIINIFLAWFHTYIQEKNQKFLEMQLLLQKEYDTARYYDELLKQDERQKVLIHDIRKHLRAIAELNEKKETDKIAAYIRQIVQSSRLQDSVRICDNNLLNTLILRAKWQCEESGTSLITDIRSETTRFLSEYDITSLFSNLLDNAIEATRDIPNSYIELNVVPHNSRDSIITMKNSCRKNPFSDNGRLVSTKKNARQHGYGMKSIDRIVKKYNGNSHFYFDEETYTFHTIITLTNPEDDPIRSVASQNLS